MYKISNTSALLCKRKLVPNPEYDIKCWQYFCNSINCVFHAQLQLIQTFVVVDQTIYLDMTLSTFQL